MVFDIRVIIYSFQYRMPGSGGRRSRSTSHSGWAGTGKPQREMAALILAQGEQNGNLEMISHGESKVSHFQKARFRKCSRLLLKSSS